MLCTLLTIVLSWRFIQADRIWVDTFRGMTNDLVERMVGHRTRLAQENPALWHVNEDRELDGYMHLSERVDRSAMFLAAIPRAWMVVGLMGVGVAFVTPNVSVTGLAISLGGILLAQQSLASIVSGVESIAAVLRAWDQVAPLFNAAARREEKPSLVFAAPNSAERNSNHQPLITTKEISFRYRRQGRFVLERCSLTIQPGERLLLEGPSGGGKSTFAAVIAGLRNPEEGLLLLRGYDRQSIGVDVWRRRIAVAPQFHENHVFTASFLFNLLMGRRWPPTKQDIESAEEICHELGLGDLIQRMPSGLEQMVGESGWQLSHGERSRLYIARALLQNADLMIFDESFAALDPENLERALRCVLERAPALMVIAHP
ncbi:MAG: ATP-binding cassette domain-containing protein [Chloroflexi bacterium]|nr:ATP-binding cassette domain-containing protein [Chloroflexota bacterium]